MNYHKFNMNYQKLLFMKNSWVIHGNSCQNINYFSFWNFLLASSVHFSRFNS